MNKSKLTWRKAFSAIAIGLGAIGCLDVSATAKPIENDLNNSFQLAQVGVRSRITPPTPLNLRPRVHTPLPSSNYSRYPSRSYHRYNTGYDSYRRHDHHHDDYHYRHHKNRRYRRHSNHRKVIIISPGSHGGISNYGNDGFIRIIGN